MVAVTPELTSCRPNCTVTEAAVEAGDIIRSLTRGLVAASTPVLCVIVVILLVGTCGNLLVFVTYIRRIHHSSTYFFIFCLASFDIINCCFGLPFEMFGLLHPLTNDRPWLCKFHKMIAFSADLSSGYTIVCISFDRYRKISRPYRGLSRRTSKLAVICITVSALIISSMSLFAYGTESIPIVAHLEVTGHRCGIEDFAKTTAVPLVFSVALLVCFAVGVGILLVVYTRLGLRVRRWSRRRKQDTRRRAADAGGTCSGDSSSRCESPTDAASQKQSVIPQDCSHSEPTIDVETLDNQYVQKLDNPHVQKHDDAEREMMEIQPTESLLKPGYVRELSRSLDRENGVIRFSNFHQDGCNTLPLKLVKSVSTNNRRVDMNKRKSVLNSISVFKKRMRLSKTTLMFIVATAAFVACHIPYICIKLINVLGPPVAIDQSDLELTLYKLAEYSFVVSYAVNPLIYSFVNPKFRKECKSLLQELVIKLCKRTRTYNLN